MNPTVLLTYLSAFGVPLLANQLAAAIKIKLAANPALTDAELISNEGGTLKYSVRGKIGWLVDFLWPDVEPTLDTIILQAASEARADLAAEASVVNPPEAG